MRWHPTIVKWCLYLRHQSSRAYELLRSSGCIQLPSQCTLLDYTYHITTSSGFSTELDQQLMADANISSLKVFQKHVWLLGDEMHIKEDLAYEKASGELIGFVNLGNINEHLTQLQQQVLEDSVTSPVLATSVFVLMVQGIFTSLKFPYASFPCKSTCSDQLVPLFYEAFFVLSGVGRHNIRWLLCQQAIFWSCSGSGTCQARAPDHEIYFFSDPPHLIKTVRNCLANPRRTLQVFLD